MPLVPKVSRKVSINFQATLRRSGRLRTFMSVSGYANIGKGKAYLQLPTSVFAVTRSIEVNYGDEEGTTGINSIKKINGEKAVYYNLQGQRVDKPRMGLYILKGKKVVFK